MHWYFQNFVFPYSRAIKLSIYSKLFLFFVLFAAILSFSRSLAQGSVDTPFCYMETEDGTVINLEGVCTPPQEDQAVNERRLVMSVEERIERREQTKKRIRDLRNNLCPNGYCRPGVNLQAEIDAICSSDVCPVIVRQIGYIEE